MPADTAGSLSGTMDSIAASEAGAASTGAGGGRTSRASDSGDDDSDGAMPAVVFDATHPMFGGTGTPAAPVEPSPPTPASTAATPPRPFTPASNGASITPAVPPRGAADRLRDGGLSAEFPDTAVRCFARRLVPVLRQPPALHKNALARLCALTTGSVLLLPMLPPRCHSRPSPSLRRKASSQASTHPEARRRHPSPSSLARRLRRPGRQARTMEPQKLRTATTLTLYFDALWWWWATRLGACLPRIVCEWEGAGLKPVVSRQ